MSSLISFFLILAVVVLVRVGWGYLSVPHIKDIPPTITYPEQKVLLGIPININEAGAAELQALPGIGPRTAEKIISYRKNNPPFRSPDDLARVPGIGPKTVDALRPLVITRH